MPTGVPMVTATAASAQGKKEYRALVSFMGASAFAAVLFAQGWMARERAKRLLAGRIEAEDPEAAVVGS